MERWIDRYWNRSGSSPWKPSISQFAEVQHLLQGNPGSSGDPGRSWKCFFMPSWYGGFLKWGTPRSSSRILPYKSWETIHFRVSPWPCKAPYMRTPFEGLHAKYSWKVMNNISQTGNFELIHLWESTTMVSCGRWNRSMYSRVLDITVLKVVLTCSHTFKHVSSFAGYGM